MAVTKLSPPPQKKTPPAKKPKKVNTIGSSSNSRIPNKTFSGPEVGMVGNLGGPSAKKYDKTRKKRKFGMDKGAPRDVSPAGGGSSPGAYQGNGKGPGMSAGRSVPTFNEVIKRKTGGRV